MFCGPVCGIITVAVGAALMVTSSLVGYYVIPDYIERTIIDRVVLRNDTDQLERFAELPFPLTFNIRMFNISNAAEVLAGGVPDLTEIGPYVYRLYQERLIESFEEDRLSYRILLHKEFDSEASYPHTEDDVVHVVNIPYHGLLQVAASSRPELMGILNLALGGIFGNNNGAILETRVGDFLFDGINICQNPGLLGGAACNLVRDMIGGVQNMQLQPDNSIKFSVFGYRNGTAGQLYNIYRGVEDPADLGRVAALNGEPTLPHWAGDRSRPAPTTCDMINGTDSGIFAPFIDRTKPIYALNTDICRSVELRYEQDMEYKGIPVTRFTANEWFLDNDDGCFCLNVTAGITGEEGCLLRGAMELYSCVGAYLVLTYPHFLYADDVYKNGVVGLHPVEEDHRLYLDIEPNTGTVLRGAKRAQFNVFMKDIAGIPATSNLRTTLTPALWIEEGMALPAEYAELLSDDLIYTLSLINILVPVAVALSGIVLLTGITIVICLRFKKKTPENKSKTRDASN